MKLYHNTHNTAQWLDYPYFRVCGPDGDWQDRDLNLGKNRIRIQTSGKVVKKSDSQKLKKKHFPCFIIVMDKCLIELLIEKIMSKVKVVLLFILRSWSFFSKTGSGYETLRYLPFVIQRPSLITVYIDLVWVNAYVEGGGEGEKDVGELDDQPAPQRRVLHLPVHNHLDRVDRWSRLI